MIERRVLVTGSRDWPYPAVIHKALYDQLLRLDPGSRFVVIHGAARGADTIASRWVLDEAPAAVEMMGGGIEVAEDPYPVSDADWRQHGKGAGHRRNGVMLGQSPHLVLGFRCNQSPGTTNCLEQAARARIPALTWDVYG